MCSPPTVFFRSALGAVCILWLGTLVQAAAQTNQTILTNAAQVRALGKDEAARGLPVQLRGVMISEAFPYDQALFLADDAASIYVVATEGFGFPVQRGDLLEIQGVTDPGGFAPMVQATRVVRLGTSEIPAPRAASYQQLITGALDGQWVEISGVVRQVQIESEPGVWSMILAADGGVVSIRAPLPVDPLVQDDAEVRVQAVCLYRFNQRGQVLTPVLSVPSGAEVSVEKPAPADPFAAPLRSADSLLQFTAEPSSHRLHVRGVVTHAQPGALVWIRDHSSGLRIRARQLDELKPGDEIDVLGFPAYGAYSPTLEDAVFRKIGSVQSPAPLLLTNAAAAFHHEEDLVELEALLKDVQPMLEGLALTFDLEGTIFKGALKFPPGPPVLPDWQPGSKVRVAGICSVTYDDTRPVMGVLQPQAFQILMRSPEDLTVISHPPWWTPKHIIYVLGAASIGLLLATGVLVLLSRRRLQDQARRRAMAEAEFAAILSERNRVAREIHDTLAQGLAATSVQLRLAKKAGAHSSTPSSHHLDLAQQFVRDSLEEARSSIWNMRSQVLETGDLASALSGILKQMADGSDVQTCFEVSGKARRFAPVIENNLLRVGQEAITNATRHAQARQISVNLDFGENQFRLRVRDDGHGFDALNPPPTAGGFGLMGMRERAAEVKGELKVCSTPGEGTEVILVMPFSGDVESLNC